MGAVLDLAEASWAGTSPSHPFDPLAVLEEVADGVAFFSGFANVAVVRAGGALVLIDTGSWLLAPALHTAVRAWSKLPVSTAVFTHGHIDHVMGLGPFDDEAAAGRRPAIEVVAHQAVPERFARYALTRGYNGCINSRQFGFPVAWPSSFRAPDRLYQSTLELSVGGERLSLFHARGETDDHTFGFLPERGVLFTGDLFIWASPNAGNPQKVQRYPLEWAAALRRMEAMGAEVLSPGHGPPIMGKQRVRQALSETAEFLESLVTQTLALMNQGATLDDVLATVKAPAGLMERPYLRPIYDEPAFVIRNIWRQYGGWYDGNPAHLLPAPEAALAREIAALAGGVARLVQRARELADAGELQLACHLVESAWRAAPDDPEALAARREIYARRASAATSLMAKGIFGQAAS
jgi:alkyl sulfatase BDS1-like metallo-beta-lactamase superfamily hydrolase